MRWRRISEEVPTVGTQCLCRREEYSGYEILTWTSISYTSQVYGWRDDNDFSHPSDMIDFWIPLSEIEEAICDGEG